MGCYSWVCNGCGHELKESELCVMDGHTVRYDGYGSGYQGNPSCWHKVCYESSDKKEKPSLRAPNQGFGHAALAFLPNFNNSAPIKFKVLFFTCTEIGESFVQSDFYVIKNEDFEVQDQKEYRQKYRLVEEEIADAFMKEHDYDDSAYDKLREEIENRIGMKSPERNAVVFDTFQEALEIAERLIPSNPNGYDLVVIGVQDRLEGLYFERNVSETGAKVSYMHGILAKSQSNPPSKELAMNFQRGEVIKAFVRVGKQPEKIWQTATFMEQLRTTMMPENCIVYLYGQEVHVASSEIRRYKQIEQSEVDKFFHENAQPLFEMINNSAQQLEIDKFTTKVELNDDSISLLNGAITIVAEINEFQGIDGFYQRPCWQLELWRSISATRDEPEDVDSSVLGTAFNVVQAAHLAISSAFNLYITGYFQSVAESMQTEQY
jgi:hypothetical protein